MSKRLKMIDQISKAINEHIRDINKTASISRKPMCAEDKKRCLDLRNAIYHLGKAGYHITQAKANDTRGDYPKPIKHPVLAVRCHECKRVYLATALAYGVDEDFSQYIKDAIANGDEVFISESVTLQMCHCEKEGTNKEEE